MKTDALKTHRISDGQQLSVNLLNYGARIAGIDFAGHSVALGYDEVQDYFTDPFYLGATIGPITNRIANAQLAIDQNVFQLPANEGNNCLHSGGVGFDKEFWTLTQANDSMVEYELEYDLSKLGMRGLLKTTVCYSVDQGALKIDYLSQCDTATFINLTNHVYLNLSGHNQSIEDHEFSLNVQSFVDVDNDSIPTGEITLIDAPFFYRLGRESAFVEFDGLVDHHFNSDFSLMLSAKSLASGISMDVYGNAPGFQFYTGKYLDQPFEPSSGFCVETQLAPDAINQPNFYSPILSPGELRNKRTIFQFAI